MLNHINPQFISFIRSVSDVKLGIPIIFQDNRNKNLLFGFDRMNEQTFNNIRKTHSSNVYLLISEQRKRYLNLKKAKILCTNLDFRDLQEIAFSLNVNSIQELEVYELNTLENDALKFLKLIELFPVGLMTEYTENYEKSHDNVNLNFVDAVNMAYYINSVNNDMYEVCRADLKLKSAKAEIICFRSQFSKDHYAVIIMPKKHDVIGCNVPLVRIHSSCFTGDLLNSIRCDCHDQLKNAIKAMREETGGIIIYLNQEGRGIGLTNKIRVYKAQKKGLDTVEANEYLGFDDDSRGFEIAANILKRMRIHRIKLLSNNPKKTNALEKNGIIIDSVISHQFLSPEIENYYKSKKDKFKHNINI